MNLFFFFSLKFSHNLLFRQCFSLFLHGTCFLHVGNKLAAVNLWLLKVGPLSGPISGVFGLDCIYLPFCSTVFRNNSREEAEWQGAEK